MRYDKQVKKMDKFTLRNIIFTSITDSIKNYSKLPDYHLLGLTKQSMNYYIKRLKIEGIIQRIGYGTWQLNKEYNPLLSLQRSKKITLGKCSPVQQKTSKKIRGHGFIISFLLPQIDNWKKRTIYMDKNKIIWKPLKNMKNSQRIIFRNHKCWLTDNKLVIYSPKGQSYFSKSASESENYALYDLLQIVKGIENLFKKSFKIRKNYVFEVSRQHYGKIHDDMAKHYDRQGDKLEIRNKNGLWLIADKSFKLNETETVHKKTAVKDMDNVMSPFLNGMKDHFESTGESLTMNGLLEVVNKTAENQEYHAENIKTHISAIKKMSYLLEKIESKL